MIYVLNIYYTYVFGSVCIWREREIYYEELAHVIMKTEKFQAKIRSADWRPMA